MSYVKVFIFKAHLKPQDCSTSEPGARQKKSLQVSIFPYQINTAIPWMLNDEPGTFQCLTFLHSAGAGSWQENPGWNFDGSFAMQAQPPAWWVKSVPWEWWK